MADKDTKTPDSPVQYFENKDTIQGQPQARPAEPHDGQTLLHEVVVHTDRVILDPNDDLAVQVPEGVGASTVGQSPALTALREGTAEEQFERAGNTDESTERDAESPASSSKDESGAAEPKPSTRSKQSDKS